MGAPGKVLEVVKHSDSLALHFSDAVFTFQIEGRWSLSELSEWVSGRFEFASDFSLCAANGDLLAETWIAQPGLDPVVLKISSLGLVQQVLPLVERVTGQKIGKFTLPLDATPSDLRALLGQRSGRGSYQFFTDEEEIFADSSKPIFEWKMPMGPIGVTFSAEADAES
jgi:hypothetical protein